jgi:hypothetical protein
MNYNVGFEALAEMAMKNSFFWDILPCIPVKVNRRFSGTQRRHLKVEE